MPGEWSEHGGIEARILKQFNGQLLPRRWLWDVFVGVRSVIRFYLFLFAIALTVNAYACRCQKHIIYNVFT